MGQRLTTLEGLIFGRQFGNGTLTSGVALPRDRFSADDAFESTGIDHSRSTSHLKSGHRKK